MRPSIAVVVILAAGCASPKSVATGAPSTPAAEQSGAASPINSAFVGSFERTWQALPGAYASLGIKVNIIDTATRAVGFAGTVRHKIGAVKISQYFECGTEQGDVVADAWDVAIVVATQMGRTPEGGMRLTTQVRAKANQPQFAHSNALCTSKGTFEKALYDSLRARPR